MLNLLALPSWFNPWGWTAIAVVVIIIITVIVVLIINRDLRKKKVNGDEEFSEAVDEDYEEVEEETVKTETKKGNSTGAAQSSKTTQNSKPATKPEAKPKTEAKPAPKPNEDKKETKMEENKSAAKIYHISKRKEDGRWQVKAAGAAKALKLFMTQAEAIEFAKKTAGNQEAKIMIHKEDGSFRRLTYK